MAQLPSGTITFLFSDIEGSTRLLGTLGDDYSGLLDKHRQLLTEAFTSHQGEIIDTHGDSFFVAFPAPTSALAAALEGQRALKNADWPRESSVRVRMGIHTGEAKLLGNRYVGMEVHRAARIGEAGHGEQILVSESSRLLLEDSLTSEVSLVDLGTYRLKDLPRPEHIHQIVTEDLVTKFPALRSVEADRARLHPPASRLIGRDREKDEIMWLLGDPQVRLMTLTGPGGMGKTRLAIEVAVDLQDVFDHGAVFVPLAPLSSGATVLPAILQALNAAEDAARTPLETLKEVLRERQLLLVLDNFEHVMDATPLVMELLETSEGLRILVTSREVLRLTSEREYAVPPLTIPDEEDAMETISRSEAVRLFVERARSIDSSFELTSENAGAVARICCLVDGLPLAIELAAARVRILPPGAICGRLEESLDLLAGGPRDLPERQRTLSSTISWSYELLNTVDKALFECVGVFAGGWTLDAMSAVCPYDDNTEIFESLASLIDKSLVYRSEDSGSEPRFSMLRSVRDFALQRLEVSDKHVRTRDAHATYFLEYAQTAEPAMRTGEQIQWMERLDSDIDNARAAIRWFLERGNANRVAEMGWALWPYWWILNRFDEGMSTMQLTLDQLKPEDVDARGKASVVLGILAFGKGRLDVAVPSFESGLEFCNQTGNDLGAAVSLCFMGVLAALGDPDRAMGVLDQGLERAKASGDDWAVPFALFSLGRVLVLQQKHEEAIKVLDESVAHIRPLGERVVHGLVLINLGWAHLACKNLSRAASALGESLRLLTDVGNTVGIARALEGHAATSLAFGNSERAAVLFGAAEGARRSVGASLWIPDSFSHAQTENGIRGALEPQTYESLWTEGTQLSIENATKMALAESSGVR